MRARLLEATIACLVEYGYAGTTMTRIAAEAGVTRGAVVHHFGSLSELVTESVKFLAGKRATAALEQVASLRTSEDVTEKALDLLWQVHQGPLFIATVELWVAARIDRRLAVGMNEFEVAVVDNITQLAVGGPEFAETLKEVRGLAFLAMDTIRGILISTYFDETDERRENRWRRSRAQLVEFAEMKLPVLDIEPLISLLTSGPLDSFQYVAERTAK